MAEAFGLAVNIATIVELSTKIAKVCLQYSKEVTNAREEIARVEKEVLNLKVVAESASELLEGPHGATLKTSKSLLSAAQEAGSRLKALDVELRPSSTRKAMRRFGVRAFKWPFQSKDVEKLVQDIVKYAQMISMGLQIDQTAILLSLDQKFILAKLPTAPDASFDSHAEEHNPTCLPSTRVELLKELDQWIKDPSAEAVFWLSGMAGTGKSTISRTVAQSLAKKDQLGASFFFKRGEGDRGHASKFFTTVASQLVSRLPMLALHVKGAIDADPAIHTKFLREQFKRLIFEPLLKVQGDYSGGSVVIVVDALDECEQDNDIKVIINLFSSGKSLKSPRLKVLLTSRPELPIRLGFSAVRGTYNNLVLHEIPAPVIEHDISAFLEHELARIRDDYNSSVSDERRLSPAWPGKANFQTLVRMAIPLFIFAATTCRFLDQHLVSKLDLTYRPALDQQLAGLSLLEGNEVLQEFRNIVGTIILLSSPLSAGALAKLLNVSQKDVNDRLDMLHSVLDVPKEPEFPVRLLHLSFRDFLVDRLYQDSNPFWIDEREVHRQTATNCLRVMRNHLQEDILDLKVPGTPPSKVNSLDDDRLPPQVKYACLYWAHHAGQAGSGADLLGTVYDFLCRHFLHWLEVLGWLGKAYETLPMLRAIQSAAADSDAGALQEFIGDAVRFVQSNLHMISTAPLQLYSSAHVFTPQRSIVRRTFAETTPSWIFIQPEPEHDWDQCLQKLEGHTGVYYAAFSYDSTLIVSASFDEVIRIWRRHTGECIRRFEGHDDQVRSVAFSHDSALIVDQTVQVWRTDTGECICILKGHSDSVHSAAFSHDSALIVSSSSDCTIQVWRVSTGECIQKFKGHSQEVFSAGFSHDSTLTVSASADGVVRIWNTEAEKHIIEKKEHSEAVGRVIISHDSDLIVSSSDDTILTVYIWRTGTGKCTRKLEGHNRLAVSVAFSHDSVFVVSASNDETIRVWNADTGDCIKVVHTYRWDVGLLSFQPGIISSEPSCLVTNIGAMAFTSSATETQPCDFVTLGLGLSRDRCWITWNDQNLFWLPAEFRSPEIGVGGTIVRGSTVAIGCTSGRVLVFRFDEAALRMMYNG
ncbi:WD40 repeat-like protein [Colletotrichum falcatum]|nr:WD40 repeat-like protein [Colletotrichum falcatum]